MVTVDLHEQRTYGVNQGLVAAVGRYSEVAGHYAVAVDCEKKHFIVANAG